MGIITLTTDLGLEDYYVASLKAKLYQNCPDVNIVDITHNVSSFDVQKAAYHVNGCFRDFPDNTIHVIGVKFGPIVYAKDAKDIQGNKNIDQNIPSIMKFENQYFVSYDSNFFGLLLGDNEPQEFWNIDGVLSNPKKLKDTNKSILLDAAINLYQGRNIENFAYKAEGYQRMLPIVASLTGNSIVGRVFHIDKYGNAITNITKKDFESFGENIPFMIRIGRQMDNRINVISTTYDDVPMGELVALFNANDLLELAISHGAEGDSGGGISSMFRLEEDTMIRVVFQPRDSSNSLSDLFS